MAADSKPSDQVSVNAESSDRQRLPFEPKAKAKVKDVAPAADSSAAKSNVRKSSSSKDSPKASSSGGRTKKTADSEKADKFAAIRQAARDAREGRKPAPAKVASLDESRIPDAIGQRMLGRVLIFSGVPTLLGVLVFFVSYYVMVNDLYDIPNVAVLLSSMLGFGLGVVGLSYGVLSASWDEDEPGSALGFSEFGVNSKRLLAGLKEFRSNRRGS
jgi:uncharacterized membrane protein